MSSTCSAWRGTPRRLVRGRPRWRARRSGSSASRRTLRVASGARSAEIWHHYVGDPLASASLDGVAVESMTSVRPRCGGASAGGRAARGMASAERHEGWPVELRTQRTAGAAELASMSRVSSAATRRSPGRLSAEGVEVPRRTVRGRCVGPVRQSSRRPWRSSRDAVLDRTTSSGRMRTLVADSPPRICSSTRRSAPRGRRSPGARGQRGVK